MDTISWNDSLSIGNDELDAHHKAILELINSLYDKEQHILPSKVLDDLIDFISYHFPEEQEFMEKINYPKTKEHLDEHDTFIEKVLEMTVQAFEDNLTIIDLRLFLMEWFKKHISMEDRAVFRYQKERNILDEKYK